MEVKLLSGALGAEIKGIDLKDTSDKNFNIINNFVHRINSVFYCSLSQHNTLVTFPDQSDCTC